MKKFLVLSVLLLQVVQSFSQTTPTFQVKTVSDLVLTNVPVLNNRLTALVTGRVSANDGAGGLFFYEASSSTATNRGTVFKPSATTGRWLREYVGAVDIKWFGAVGDGTTEDTLAVQNALDVLNTAGGGELYVSPGTYVVDSLTNYSNIKITGVLGESILRQKSGATYVLSVNPGSGGSSSYSDNATNITIRGITFHGRSVEDAFSEHRHLLNINAVSDVVIEDCKFLAPQGDGIYLGSGNVGGIERHNRNVVIRSCFFDGVNSDNRNGISVIDCDGLVLRDCFFTRLTRSNMPGAIDLEPDSDLNVMKNISILDNAFSTIGGNVGVISANLRSMATVTTPYFGFNISGNKATNCLALVIQTSDVVTNSTRNMGIAVSKNVFNQADRGFNFQNIKGLVFSENMLKDCVRDALIGGATAYSQDLIFIDNIFDTLSTDTGNGIQVHGVGRLIFQNNIFRDVKGNALDFNNGTSSYVYLIRNTVYTPAAVTTFGWRKEASHTFTPSTNQKRDNVFISVSGDSFDDQSTATFYNISAGNNLTLEGNITLTSGGTITSDTGDITLATGGGSGSLLFTPVSGGRNRFTSGNVGIGIDPSNLLHVSGNASSFSGNQLVVFNSANSSDNVVVAKAGTVEMSIIAGTSTTPDYGIVGPQSGHALRLRASGDDWWEVTTTGNLVGLSAGKGIQIKEGSNARMGNSTLVGGTVTVANTSVTANTRIFLSRATTGGTTGDLSYTKIASTSFTINSSSGTDTSTVDWLLVEPSP